ncbi:class I SAM-dependent methyltransferase [Microvirga flavescens]|uniref:class I SAM-dependent methyltransferase n=1 Tax=Microvirga flavescens TaxID=2249811 RepID=UPI001300B0E4|nr:class I SAM-dependent methyltransferase [Microvirga flavescens]
MSKSYTSNTTLMTKAREAWRLRQWHATNAASRVKQVIEVMDELEETLRARYGLALEGLDVLDIGTGQQQIQSAWLARRNRVTGIDLDVIAKGWSPWPYLKMARENGANRTVKTLARKALGLDAMYSRALFDELGRTANDLSVQQMDVMDIRLASGSFDFVYCSSVLQCVPDVPRALEEMNRVLKPGGVGYFTVQLYSSETGSLDPRLYGGDRSDIPYWAHLRPTEASKVAGNAWLNKLRLSEWREHVGANLFDPTIELSQPKAEALEPLAQSLHRMGELRDYTLEELLTHELRVSWSKKNGRDG